MADWTKLNAEFEGLLSKMTDEDWSRWDEMRKLRRKTAKIDQGNEAKTAIPANWPTKTHLTHENDREDKGIRTK